MLRVTHKRSVDISRFEANLFGIILPMGLRVERVHITGADATVIHEPFSATLEDPGRLEVFVKQEDIAGFLNQTAPAGLKNVTVEAMAGFLHVRATKTVIIDVKAYVVCSLRIVGESKLFVDLESVDVMGVGTKQLMQSQIDKINPIIDTTDFPVASKLETVEVVEGGILLRGRISPPA